MYTSLMSRRTRQTGGGLTDRLPIARGAALGAAAYVVGYIITYLFVQVDDELEAGAETLSQASAELPGIDIGTIDVVGWAFYSAQFVDTEISVEAAGESQAESGNLISEASSLTIPEPIWYLVPVVCLVGAGFLTAKAMDRHWDTGEAAKAGATVTAGYLPLAAVGAFIFTKSTETSTFGQSVSISLGPDMVMAVVLIGIAYPLILGAAGGALASQTASTSGARPRGGRPQQPPHGQQSPQGQQRQPPQGGQQGQPPQGGQQGQGQSNQGNQRRR